MRKIKLISARIVVIAIIPVLALFSLSAQYVYKVKSKDKATIVAGNCGVIDCSLRS